MTYTYKCSKCKKHKDIELPLGQDLPKDVICECGQIMVHSFIEQAKTQSIKVPYWFKAVNDTGRHRHSKKDATSELM